MVDEGTAGLLAKRWSNPLALEIVLGLKRIQDKAEDGALRLTPAEIERIPQAVEDLYRTVWQELPEPVQNALMLAALGVPVSVSLKNSFGDDRWDPQIIAALVDGVLPEARAAQDALASAPTAYAWAWHVEELLRRFHEPSQREVAFSYSQDRVADEQAFTTLARLIDISDQVPDQTRLHRARLLWGALPGGIRISRRICFPCRFGHSRFSKNWIWRSCHEDRIRTSTS